MNEPPSDAASRTIAGPAADPGRSSFGAWLRHQREARSVSLREIADASKISLRYLDALEQDRFDVLPAPVFARGFLREYARVVGLNPDEVVNLFLLAVEDKKGGASGVEPSRAQRAKRAPSSLGYGLLLALAVIAFLAVAAILSFYAERRQAAAPPSSLVAPRSAAPAPKPAPPAADPGTGLGIATAGADPVVAPSGADTGAEPAVPEPLKVVLSFLQDCWVESVVDGRRRTSELRAGGETITLEADESVVLTLGNAAAVTVEVNGRPFSLPAGSTRVVRELRIDRATAGLAEAPPALTRP